MSKAEQRTRLQALLRQHRWAALATLDDRGTPEASMVAYAVNDRFDEIYLHLSELASHTRNLLQHPRIALVISETDRGEGDPQQLPRATLYARVERLNPDDRAYRAARECYLARLPDAQMLFSFADFHLFRLRLEKLRFVGGFGQAFNFQPTELTP